MKKYQVLLSADSSKFTQSARYILEENDIFEIIGCAEPENLIIEAVKKQPDVILWKLHDETAGDTVEILKRECPFSYLIVGVEEPYSYDIMDILSRGINGCIPLNIPRVQMERAIELIVFGGMTCLPRLEQRDFNSSREKDRKNAYLRELTVRERAVLELLCQSLSNQEIGDILNISESTVKTHLRNIFKKFEVRNRSEALALMLDLDIKAI